MTEFPPNQPAMPAAAASAAQESQHLPSQAPGPAPQVPGQVPAVLWPGQHAAGQHSTSQQAAWTPAPAAPGVAGQGAWAGQHAAPEPRLPAWSGPETQRAPASAPPVAARPESPGAAPAAATMGVGNLASTLQQEAFSTPLKPQPRSGWRKAVLASSFGLINPGESRIERDDRHRADCVKANIPRGAFTFAVMSARGGVSKTTTTAALGSMFARLRGAEVIAVDANPNEGNLGSRIDPSNRHTFADILRHREKLSGNVNDIREFTGSNRGHTGNNGAYLDVLGADQTLINPAVFDPETFNQTLNVLRTNYRVVGIDCGQNINDATTAAILDSVTALVVVAGVQYDAEFAALRLHDWLLAQGRTQLLQRSILVISDRSPKSAPKLRAAFEQAVAATVWKDPVYVPFDPHLAEAGVINLAALEKKSARAYLDAAARLAAHYGAPPVPLAGPAV